ncbi:uncharacterized protein [Eucyclogobius newberryi]|uniref:uncharacterized protein n=1 Tax=Eucyclogobius newberryi TaxID=166745 RepID=UPI003B5A472A
MDGYDNHTSVEEVTSPPSPKRPRPDHAEANNGKKLIDSPQLLTFPQPGFIQQNRSQTCSENLPLETTHIQSFDHFGTDSTVQAQKSKVSITDITETDRLILNMLFDSDDAATASHDCSSLGKSLQCEHPVVFCLARRDTDEGRQVQNSGSHVQIVTLTRAEEDVRCQADCSYEEAPRDEDTDMQNGALATAEERNQQEIECEFSKKPLRNNKMEQVKKDSCLNHFWDSESFSTNPKVCPSSSLAEAGENNDETLELQNVASCDGKAEAQFNEGRKQSSAAAGERDVETVAENMSLFYAKYTCEAKKAETVEELSSEVGIQTANDTTETQTSVSISQVITEGDNDAASFCVIDPVKRSGADRPAAEKHCTGFETSASEKLCKMDENRTLDTAALQGGTVKLPGPEQTGQLHFQSLEQQQFEYEKACLSHTEAATDKTRATLKSDKSDTENRWRPTSPCCGGSAIFDSAEDQSGGSRGTVEDELKEKNQSGSLSGSLDHPEVQVVEHSRRDMTRKNETGEKEITVVSMNGDNGLWLKEVVLLQNMYKVTNESAHCNSRNKSNCSSGVQGGIDSAGFADNQHTSCKTACKENTVEGRAMEEEINEKEATSVGSEQFEVNMADIQFTDLNKLEVEGEMMQSKEKGVKEDTSEHALVELVLEQEKDNTAEKNHSTCHVLTENSFGIVEHQGEKATALQMSPQQNTNVAIQLPSEFHQTFGNFLKQSSDKDIDENTLNANLHAAKSNDSLTSCEAAVPGINNSGINSQRSDHSVATLHDCNGRFSPAPSAFPFTKQTPVGCFDTFEKIQLSPDNDMDSSALGNRPLLASPPRQMLENPQHQVHDSNSRESEMTEEIELSNPNEDGCLSNRNTCNEVPSPILAADVMAQGWPELCDADLQIYDCFQDDSNLDFSIVSIESDFSDCEGNGSHAFEMKMQFDTVLEELKLFFEISASDMSCGDDTSSLEPLREIAEALEEGEASKCKDDDESPEEPDAGVTSLDDPVVDVSLECEGVAVGSGAKSREGEQEVPRSSCELQQTATRYQPKDTEGGETEQRQRMWSPSFMLLPLVEQLTQKLLEPQRRLEPLRTCSRPIRVGLSKRAKTRNLHHPHPYK